MNKWSRRPCAQGLGVDPCLLNLLSLFWGVSWLFLLAGTPSFLERFLFVPQEFNFIQGSEEKTPCSFGGFPCLCPKQGKERSEKNAPRIWAEIFGFKPIPGVAPRIAPRIGLWRNLGRECKFESCSENALQGLLREWLFTPRAFFQIWVVPRFLTNSLCRNLDYGLSFSFPW